ncbi:peptidoglycan editing factor PgeF [Dongia deserti]|uniref:peptidoglycan editing factor PgeF n=1 Tax=Dongia deserti TaxID=2268030 RepID=UPI000E653CEB|nr:peptidoglycan editing factor PgeF [Dongia deserti]
MIKLSVFETLPGIRHGFMTRAGGVSEGIYDSLNCGLGSDDEPERVRENRRRVLKLADIPANTLLTAYQVHSPDVLVVEEEWRDGPRPKVDALVTRRSNIAIAASSADCVPILFADPEARVVGAAHAGWRGAVSGVLQATVKQMCALGARPERIRAGVGPCIGPASYEVGPEFPAPFLAQDPANARYFRPAQRDGHYMFDLESYVAAALEAMNLAEIEVAHRDTCAEAGTFFSYRRSVLRKEPDYGRHVSVIGLV